MVQREVLEVPAYVELWLADAGLTGSPDYRHRYAEWLDYFAGLGIEAVGMGWLLLTRAGRDDPWLRIEDWPYAVEQPIAPAFAAEAGWISASRLPEAEILTRAWALTADVVEETTGQPGAADPQHIVLRQQRGFRRAVEADTGTGRRARRLRRRPARSAPIVDALADLLAVDPAALRADIAAPVPRRWSPTAGSPDRRLDSAVVHCAESRSRGCRPRGGAGPGLYGPVRGRIGRRAYIDRSS